MQGNSNNNWLGNNYYYGPYYYGPPPPLPMNTQQNTYQGAPPSNTNLNINSLDTAKQYEENQNYTHTQPNP